MYLKEDNNYKYLFILEMTKKNIEKSTLTNISLVNSKKV